MPGLNLRRCNGKKWSLQRCLRSCDWRKSLGEEEAGNELSRSIIGEFLFSIDLVDNGQIYYQKASAIEIDDSSEEVLVLCTQAVTAYCDDRYKVSFNSQRGFSSYSMQKQVALEQS